MSKLSDLYAPLPDSPIPNEPLYTSPNTIDPIIFYPQSDQYPNKYKPESLIRLPSLYTNQDPSREVPINIFNDTLAKDRITYAIKYLQIIPLKKYITPINNHNPFNELFNCHYPVSQNTEAYKTIIKILIANIPDSINLINQTSPMFMKNNNESTKQIQTMLFEELPVDESNICTICLITEPNTTLIKPCNCTTKIHVDCFIQMLQASKQANCTICKAIYRRNVPVYGCHSKPNADPTIYFPYDDIYPVPLMTSRGLVKYTGMNRLDMAINYLQVDRVRDLLNDPEIVAKLPTHLFGYEGYKNTAFMQLCGSNIGNNHMYNLGDNAAKYEAIMKLLYQTGTVDLNQLDAFDHTAKDSAMEHGMLDVYYRVVRPIEYPKCAICHDNKIDPKYTLECCGAKCHYKCGGRVFNDPCPICKATLPKCMQFFGRIKMKYCDESCKKYFRTVTFNMRMPFDKFALCDYVWEDMQEYPVEFKFKNEKLIDMSVLIRECTINVILNYSCSYCR